MRKKTERADLQPKTDKSPDSSPRRAKLMKKRGRTPIHPSTEEQTSPHLVEESVRDAYSDESSISSEERIAVRAYERYVERGGHHGQDLHDWLEAEREVMTENECSS